MADSKATANAAKTVQLGSETPKAQSLLQTSLEPSKPMLKDLAPKNKYLEWLINLKAEKHTLNGDFTVHAFLGPVPEDQVSLWPLSAYHVGTFAPLGQAHDTGCIKCRKGQRDHLQVTGQIPLTIALIERYLAQLIPDLSVDTVVPYLTENLHWRVESVSRF